MEREQEASSVAGTGSSKLWCGPMSIYRKPRTAESGSVLEEAVAIGSASTVNGSSA